LEKYKAAAFGRETNASNKVLRELTVLEPGKSTRRNDLALGRWADRLNPLDIWRSRGKAARDFFAVFACGLREPSAKQSARGEPFNWIGLWHSASSWQRDWRVL